MNFFIIEDYGELIVEKEEFVQFSRNFIEKFGEKLSFQNPRSVKRFLNCCSVLFDSNQEDPLLIKQRKNLITKVEEINSKDSYNQTLSVFHSILMIYEKKQLINDKKITDLIEKKLIQFKNDFFTKNESKFPFLLLEELLFVKEPNKQKISNQISIELLYYTLNYRITNGMGLSDNLLEMFKKNYYISQQKEFALYPTYESRIYSIHSSRTDSLEKDYWASLILKMFEKQGFDLLEWKNILNEMIERSLYFIDSYQETGDLSINLHTFHALKVLNTISPDKIPKFNKIIMNYETIELSSNLLVEIQNLTKLDWANIEWENYLIDDQQDQLIQKYIQFFSDSQLFDGEIIDYLKSYYNSIKSGKEILSIQIKIRDYFEKNDKIKHLFYVAYICSDYNIFTLPIEFFIENEINQQISNYFLQLVFLKLYLDNFTYFGELLRDIFSTYDKVTVLSDNKGHRFLLTEDEIVKFLSIYQYDSYKKERYENPAFLKVLEQLKSRFKHKDLPKLKPFISNYVVYPRPLVKLDSENGKIKGIRLTIEIKDIELKQEIQNIKDYYNIFFNEICNYAQTNYQIREFLEDSNGNRNMIEFLKGLFEDGYQNIIKIDIKSCTDRMLYPPLKYILFKTLPDEFAELVFDVARKYTIEFEDRRITPSRGIAQGNPLSNELYTSIILILLMGTLEEFNQDRKNIICLGFGDDILILSKSIDALGKIYPSLISNFSKMGWDFDKEKTLLVSNSNSIPENLGQIKRTKSFTSVGFHINISQNDIEISLISERIFRIKYQFYHALAQLIQNLADQENASLIRFIEAADAFNKDSIEYPIHDSDGFKLLDYIIHETDLISKKLKIDITDNPISDFKDLEKLYYSMFSKLPIIPPQIQFNPDIIVYTDGAAEPNPGDAGIGVFIPSLKIEDKYYLGSLKTNNEAEYSALLCALRILYEKNQLNKIIQIYSDSKIMVSHLNGINYVKDIRLKELRNYIKIYEKKIKKQSGMIRYTHIYGKTNTEADRLSREALEDHKQGKGKRFFIKKSEMPVEK